MVSWLVFAVIAGAFALLAWGAIELGSKGLQSYRGQFEQNANLRLREMFLFMDPARLFALHFSFILLALMLVWVSTRSWVLAGIVMVCAFFIPRLVLAWMRHRRLLQLENQLPDALLILAGSMRAGSSLASGLQVLVAESQPPLSQEFELMLREQRVGVSIDESLTHLDQRVPLQSMTLAISAMRIAVETGGGLAEALERAASTLRSKLAMEGKIRALTAQGKLQAVVVGLLPFVLMMVLMRMEPIEMPKLFYTKIGWGVLTVIVLLEFFGVLIIRKIVRIDV